MRCEPYNMVPWNIPKHVKDVFCMWVSSVQISQIIRKRDISRFSSIFKVGHFKEKAREQISNRKETETETESVRFWGILWFSSIWFSGNPSHVFWGISRNLLYSYWLQKTKLHKLRNSSHTRLDLGWTIYSRATTVTGQVRSCINLVATARHQLIRSSINIFD